MIIYTVELNVWQFGSHFYREAYDGRDGVYLTLTPYAEPNSTDTFFFVAYNSTEGEC